MASGFILLGDVADRTEWLDVACNRCDRRGRLSITKLIAAHSPAMPMPALRMVVARDCPRWDAGSIADLCGVHFPQLADLFLHPK